MMDLIREMTAQIETTAALDALLLPIFDKAFRGELVPQDPTDEPAKKLLECLRSGKNLCKS